MGYFQDTLKGVTWIGGLRASTRVLAILKIAVLARLLSPVEVGLFGIASIVLAFLEIVTETGINIILIQENADLDEYVDTAWLVSIGRGILISLVIVLTAPLIVVFFNSPESKNILYLVALVPLIRGFINPSMVKFQKDLLFAKEFFSRFSIFTIDTVFTILLAYITKSALALVFGLIAGAIFELFISFIFVKPKPKLHFEFDKSKKVIGRGKWVTAAGLLNYFFENADDAAVGRLLNTASLGLYQYAYKISSLPITEIANVVTTVTFPVYVKISEDMNRLKKAFIKTLVAVSLVSVPIGVVLLVFTEPIVYILLGEKWIGVVPVVKALSFFGVIRAISSCSYPLLLALKKQEYVTAITLVSIVGLAIPLIPMVKAFGILGAGYSALIGAMVALPVSSFLVIRILKNAKS